MTLRAVYLRVVTTQAHTDSRKTTDAVRTIARFLRWKILRRSRNVGSLSGTVFNFPLPSMKCVSRGPDNAFSSKTIEKVLSLLQIPLTQPRLRTFALCFVDE